MRIEAHEVAKIGGEMLGFLQSKKWPRGATYCAMLQLLIQNCEKDMPLLCGDLEDVYDKYFRYYPEEGH